MYLIFQDYFIVCALNYSVAIDRVLWGYSGKMYEHRTVFHLISFFHPLELFYWTFFSQLKFFWGGCGTKKSQSQYHFSSLFWLLLIWKKLQDIFWMCGLAHGISQNFTITTIKWSIGFENAIFWTTKLFKKLSRMNDVIISEWPTTKPNAIYSKGSRTYPASVATFVRLAFSVLLMHVANVYDVGVRG